jgi:hypothetical protein
MVQRLGLSDVNSLPDPLLAYQFQWIVPNIPGSGSGAGLQLRCRSATVPGEQKDDVAVDLHGVTLKFAGRTTFNHDLSFSFYETRDGYVMNQLKAWLAYSRNIIQTTGTYKKQYSTTSFIYLFDDTNSVIKQIKLNNTFLKDMQDISGFEGGSSSPIEISATMSFDWPEFI